MNKWISISIICVLVAGIAASLFLYFQESSNLKAAESEIVTLEGTVSTLEGTVSTLEEDLSVAEAEVTRLEGELAAEEAEVTRLEGELAAEEAEVTRLEGELADAQAEISALEADLAAAQAEVTRLEGELSAAEDKVTRLEGELEDAQAVVSILSEELSKIRSPRHFVLLSELTSWLEQDDTDTAYAGKSEAELVFILQVKALRDGYLLPAHFEDLNLDYIADIAGNLAYIGDKIYLVRPYEDTYTLRFHSASYIQRYPLSEVQDILCTTHECHGGEGGE